MVIPKASPMIKSFGDKNDRLDGTRPLLRIAYTVAFWVIRKNDIQSTGRLLFGEKDWPQQEKNSRVLKTKSKRRMWLRILVIVSK